MAVQVYSGNDSLAVYMYILRTVVTGACKSVRITHTNDDVHVFADQVT